MWWDVMWAHSVSPHVQIAMQARGRQLLVSLQPQLAATAMPARGHRCQAAQILKIVFLVCQVPGCSILEPVSLLSALIATLGHGQVQLQVHALLAMQGHGLRLRQHLAPHVLLGHTLTLLARQRYQLARRVQLGLTQLLHQLRAQTARPDTILRVVHPRA